MQAPCVIMLSGRSIGSIRSVEMNRVQMKFFRSQTRVLCNLDVKCLINRREKHRFFFIITVHPIDRSLLFPTKWQGKYDWQNYWSHIRFDESLVDHSVTTILFPFTDGCITWKSFGWGFLRASLLFFTYTWDRVARNLHYRRDVGDVRESVSEARIFHRI